MVVARHNQLYHVHHGVVGSSSSRRVLDADSDIIALAFDWSTKLVYYAVNTSSAPGEANDKSSPIFKLSLEHQSRDEIRLDSVFHLLLYFLSYNMCRGYDIELPGVLPPNA